MQLRGVDVDGLGNVYISDQGNNRVVKLNAVGVQQQVFSTTSPSLSNPGEVDVDSFGNVYISDQGNKRIVKLNAIGIQQQTFSTSSPSLTFLYGLCIDNSGNLYACDNGNSRIVVFGASTSITGDPQFVGFQGQHFQFHGIPDEHFNLISTSDFFVNSHFVYLASGTTEVYNDTEPFSHPGTYIDRLSFVLKGIDIELRAGSHSNGFSLITINKNPIPKGKHIQLSLPNSYLFVHDFTSITIRLDIITIKITNSDYFFNLNAQLNDLSLKNSGSKHVLVSGLTSMHAQTKISKAYPETRFRMHGLLGQTWRNIEYTDKLLYQGDTNDYLVDHLFSPDFAYSLYNVEA